MKNVYEQIQQRLDKINFQKLWNGFQGYDFALYDTNMVLMNGEIFPRTEEFYGNTAILYKGKYIAIWHLTQKDDKNIDIDILTSKMVHEMFHAYQQQQKERRFANEYEAICKYQYTPYYLQLKYNENLILAELVTNFKEEKLAEFLSYRKIRQTEFPYEYQYENCIEAIEGSAQYVEMQALQMLHEEKYQSFLEKRIHRISDMKNLIPSRIMCYDTGALFLYVCVQNNLPFDAAIGETKDIFYKGLIEQAVYQKQEIIVESEIADFYNEDRKRLKEKMDAIRMNSSEVIRGNFRLLGFNVYSARFLEEYIYSEYFLMYEDERPITLDGNFLFRYEDDRVTEIYKENI